MLQVRVGEPRRCGVAGFRLVGFAVTARKRTGRTLCDRPLFTGGYTIDGGYAEYTVADAQYCFHLAESSPDTETTAPLLCAGLIDNRAYRMAGTDVNKLGLYGFGAAGHILDAQVRSTNSGGFTLSRDQGAPRARSLPDGSGRYGLAGPTTAKLDAAIIFAPVGALVPAAHWRDRRKAARSSAAGFI